MRPDTLKILHVINKSNDIAIKATLYFLRAIVATIVWIGILYAYNSLKQKSIEQVLPALDVGIGSWSSSVGSAVSQKSFLISGLAADPRLADGLQLDDGVDSSLVRNTLYEFSFLKRDPSLIIWQGNTGTIGRLTDADRSIPDDAIQSWMRSLTNAGQGVKIFGAPLNPMIYAASQVKGLPENIPAFVALSLGWNRLVRGLPASPPIEGLPDAVSGFVVMENGQAWWADAKHDYRLRDIGIDESGIRQSRYVHTDRGDVLVAKPLSAAGVILEGLAVGFVVPSHVLGRYLSYQIALLCLGCIATVLIFWPVTRRFYKNVINVIASHAERMKTEDNMNTKRAAADRAMDIAVSASSGAGSNDLKGTSSRQGDPVEPGNRDEPAKSTVVAPQATSNASVQSPEPSVTPTNQAPLGAPSLPQNQHDGLAHGQPAVQTRLIPTDIPSQSLKGVDIQSQSTGVIDNDKPQGDVDGPRDKDAVIIDLIEDCLKNKRTTLLYQPIYGLQGKPIMHEVFLRLQNAQNDLVPPDVFLPVAEKHNLAAKLDERVLEQIMEVHFSEGRVPSTRLAVNVSGRSLADISYLEYLIVYGFRMVEHLSFEVRSQDLLSDPKALDYLRQFRDVGVRMGTDYFGGGPNMVEASRRMGFDIIKIDASRYLVDDTSKKEVIIIARNAARLGVSIILEKLENPILLTFARKAEISMVQGYLFGKPKPELTTGYLSIPKEPTS